MSALGEVKEVVRRAVGTVGADARVTNLAYAVELLIGLLEGHCHDIHPSNGDISGPMRTVDPYDPG